MDPNANLARLRELLGGDHSSHEPGSLEEALRDRPEELEGIICEAEAHFQALDIWLSQTRGFLPAAWQAAPDSSGIVRGLLQDIGEVLERQGERWWDDTVTAGLHHRWLAETLLGEPLSAGIAEEEE